LLRRDFSRGTTHFYNHLTAIILLSTNNKLFYTQVFITDTKPN